MATHRPKEWILAVLLRFDKLLASSVTQNAPLPKQLEEHKVCLINTSQTRYYIIISGLTSSLKKLFSIRIYGERQEYSLYNAQIIVLDVLEKCIAAKDNSLPEDANLMRQLLPEICQLLHQPPHDKPFLAQLQASASRVLYCISQNNFNVVFNRISTKIHDLTLNTDDFVDLSDLELIQYMQINLSRITKLLEDIVLRFRNLRKSVQIALLSSLEKALWNWLCSYPKELNTLYNETTSTSQFARSIQEGNSSNFDTLQQISLDERRNKKKQLSNAAGKMFDLLDMFTEGSKKKAALCSQMQTMLLILCPDILEQTVKRSESGNTAKYEQLFAQLRKVVTGRHVSEYCAGSYIRLLKAATCVQCHSDAPNFLHKIVDDFLPDLQVYLFENGSKYFQKTLDMETLIECFVSSFRLNKKDNLAKMCASSNSNVHHRMVLVQALHCISTQPCLEWWPSIDELYLYGADIRKIFHECVSKLQSQMHTSPRSSQSLREKMERMNVGLKRSQDEMPTFKDLLHVILQLIQDSPAILLKNLGSTGQQTHITIVKFFGALVSLFTFHNTINIQLSFESLGALLRLHDPQIIPMWNPDSLPATLWEASSTVLCNVCETLLRHQMTIPLEVTSHAIKWIHQVLACRIEFFIRDQDRNYFGYKSDIVKKAQLKLEMTLLEYLWNSDSSVVLLALSCFQCLCEDFELRRSLDSSGVARACSERYLVYRELSAITMLKDGETIQEQVTSVLLRIHKFPPASLEAWEDLREKWEKRMVLSYKLGKEDSSSIIASGDSPVTSKSTSRKGFLHEQDVVDWINMTRYLCALGGVCAKPIESTSNNTSSLNGDQRTSTSSASSNATSLGGTNDLSANDKQTVGKNTVFVTHASRFLTHLLNMLGNYTPRTVKINNAIRDLLGSSLHPALYPTLFQQMKIFLNSNLLGSSSHMLLNQSNDLFVQHMITILHKIFEQCSKQDAEYLSEESIESMILHIVRYVRHTGMSSFAVRLRIAFCKMIGEMMSRKNDFFFLSEIQFRNKLVEHLTDWIMTSSSQQTLLDKSVLSTLDESAIVAVGILLDGLPLHPDEGDGGDVSKAKSQLFLKYFTLFMKLLNEYTDQFPDVDLIDDSTKNPDQIVSLRRALIVAMSNLLSANIEYGFTHAMSLAYHKDVQTRAAFLEVLVKILQQGTAGFKSLSDSMLAERFERLVELVTMMGDNGELPIANGLANVVHTTYMDELARVFVTLFDAKHLLYQLLWNMFTKEVEEADSVQTLFRGNSLASKIMTFCFKVYGASYLHNLVEPLVAWSLSPEISSLQFDIDQKRIPPGVDIYQCRANLQRLTERFFTRIMTSTDKFPPQLKSVCHCLYQVVSQRFHESGTGAVASAIFLRFLNPSIATPYECGLCDRKLPPNLARAFKFMCKIMQNIANHVVFTKEEHMKHFNDFVKARFDVCQQFFMQISTPECTSVDSVVHSTSHVNDTNVAALHRLLWNDQEKIGKFLAKSRSAKAVGRRPFDKMVTLLAYLGPPEYTRPVLETRITGLNLNPCAFEELMTKRRAADSKEYKLAKSLNIFYQFGRSKMGYPVFYYIARRYKHAEIRENILMFYILQALKPYSARKFDVVIDLTQVGSSNSLHDVPNWLVIYPAIIYKNLENIYVYNPNTWVRDFIKYNESSFNQITGQHNIRFIEDLSQLQKFIEIDHQKIPAATRRLNEDVTCYFNACRSGNTKVNIKVSSKAVQITTVERTKLLGYDVILNDIYSAQEIEGIESSEESVVSGFNISTGNSVLLFTHPEAASIIQDIRHIRARWELTQPEQDISTHHQISAKDVPGTLLNMALLNLGCSHPMVRSCAYNLLCCLTSSFNLQLEGRLCESDGLCIPANNTLFIVSISNTLAKNESHLTLEFLTECVAGFRRSSDQLKNLCLEYMEPWLFHLLAFACSDEVTKCKVKSVINQLIDLTVAEKNFYPSVQTKIWGNLGKMSGMIDLLLECFIGASSQGGLGSIKAEVMADTSVALAANNMQLVSSKIIHRLCHVVDKTSLCPTPTLEKHKHWDEIAILARYLLMLSFNNNLDVITHLPFLFHLVSLLLSTGPLSLRASTHGLVVNIIHSLLTCRQLEFKEETQQVLRLSLTEFCLPKFYQFFGIPNVKSAADTAFKSESFVHGRSTVSMMAERDLLSGCINDADDENSANLVYLETVVDALLEVMKACMKHVSASDWLNKWQELTERFAFQYNPSLQPRALVVLGCISRSTSKQQVKQILGIMGRSLEPQTDLVLLEATIHCLTRLQLRLNASHEVHCIFFWIGISVMQMNEANLYAAGLSLVEQNLHNLDEMGAFSFQGYSAVLMKSRSNMERLFEQFEIVVNISFKSNFHYAFVTHLVKGFRHNDSVVTARIVRVLDFSLELLSRYMGCHKYDVSADSVPYLTALLPVCPEVRRYCVPRKKLASTSAGSVKSVASSKLSNGHHVAPASLSSHSVSNIADDTAANSDTPSSGSQSSRSFHTAIPEDKAVTHPSQRLSVTSNESRRSRGGNSSRRHSKRSDSRECGTTPSKLRKVGEPQDSDSSTSSGSHTTSSSMRSSQRKHSTDTASNALLDDELLDQKSQALLLTLLATHIKHSQDKCDIQVVYEYLAQASIAFPNVFPIVHSLLDQSISSVLNECEDTAILSHVQTVVHNALLCRDSEQSHRQISFLQSIGFGGMWKFACPFSKVASLENKINMVKLFELFSTTYFPDVSDLTPVPSRQSLNSALSAAFGEDMQNTDSEPELSEIDETENVDNEEIASPQMQSSVETVHLIGSAPQSGSFRSKGPKLTIKLPS